ncbi:MAG: UDP-N-acetylmuramoyl-tripeptide--D-alanyl-D-alanine ligase [Ruminococcus sp.]|nr:UDP-N-acetylmuramoyl-tripeptide--D-alanyl-D-alanine ligase [Ruminococcus sp.]
MEIVLFLIYTIVAAAAIIFTSLKEIHMLQLNGYKFVEHTRWMRKNIKQYIYQMLLIIVQFVLLATGATAPMLIALTLLNACIIIRSMQRKKAKKPLVFTARVKRLMVTFWIIEVIIIGCSSFIWRGEFSSPWLYILIGSGIYLTPALIVLSNVINKPIESSIQKWYINDAKRMLRESPNLHVIGITGSYGKTSMKFYLSELLNSQYNTLKTPESYNTPMGVVKTVRMQLKPTHEYFVCEMGARRVGEIAELCGIANPHDGIITSVGPQHLETFKSIENVVKTKFELADYIPADGKIYLNGDNELIRKKYSEYKNAVTYGLNEGNDYRAADISVSDRGTEFTVIVPDGSTCKYATKLLGEHNVQNLLGAIAYCHGIGIPLQKLVLPVKKIAAVPHRLQLLDTGGDLCYIDDAYNSNPNGCRAALNVLGLFDACKILVTPGMVELGAKQEELNYEFGTEAAKVCDFIVLVGKSQTEPIYKGITDSGYPVENVFVASGLDEAIDKVKNYKTDKKKIVLLENDLPDNY